MYYRNAQAALVAYDVTKASSLTKARHWVAELQRQASPGIVICLVGNKLDLVDSEDEAGASSTVGAGGDGSTASTEGSEAATKDAEEDTGKRKVKKEEAQKFAEEEGLLFFETSAKTGQNVAEVFAAVANAIPESSLKGRQAGPQRSAAGGADARGNEGDSRGRVDLNKVGGDSTKEGCAC